MKVVLASVIKSPSLLQLIPVLSRLSLIRLTHHIIVVGFLRLMHGKPSGLLRYKDVGYLDVFDGDGASCALLEQQLLLFLPLHNQFLHLDLLEVDRLDLASLIGNQDLSRSRLMNLALNHSLVVPVCKKVSIPSGRCAISFQIMP